MNEVKGINKRLLKKQLRRTAGGRNGEEISIKVDEPTFAKALRFFEAIIPHSTTDEQAH